jgi:nucleolar protein 12
MSDPKCTVFVGSLDFASREEDLRAFFEGAVSAERGPRSAVTGDSDSDDEESASDPNAQGTKPKTWVSRVRIVRDKDTQLGKGFAYVQFAVGDLLVHAYRNDLTG